MAHLTYRHPTEDDLPLMATVSDSSCAGLPFYRPVTLQELRVQTFGSEDFDPKGAMMAFDGDRPVAVGEAMVEKARVEHGLNEGWMRLHVVPEARGQGIEERLMFFMEAYIRGRGVKKACSRYYSVDSWHEEVLKSAGLTEVRKYSYLALVRGQEITDFPFPCEVALQRFDLKTATRAQVAAFLDIDNEVFADHWGHAPKSLDEFLRRQSVLEDVCHVTIARAGARMVGVTLVEDSVAYNREHGTNEGWVDDLGVVKEWRRRGLGKALLADGIQWLLNRGIDTVHIGVDTENDQALSLYTSAGFRVRNQAVIVEKGLS